VELPVALPAFEGEAAEGKVLHRCGVGAKAHGESLRGDARAVGNIGNIQGGEAL